MAYEKFQEDWLNRSEGLSTPFTAEAVEHMETGIGDAHELAEAAQADADTALTTATTASTNASAAVTTANAAIPLTQKGASNGVAPLVSGKVPAENIDSAAIATDVAEDLADDFVPLEDAVPLATAGQDPGNVTGATSTLGSTDAAARADHSHAIRLAATTTSPPTDYDGWVTIPVVVDGVTVATWRVPGESVSSGGTLPGAPTSFNATAGDGQIVCTWTAPADDGSGTLSDYKVYWRTPAGSGSYTLFSDGTSATTGATVTGVTNGQEYELYATSVTEVGESVPSTTDTATPVSAAGWDDEFPGASLDGAWVQTATGDNLIITDGSGRALNDGPSYAGIVRTCTGTNGSLEVILGGNSSDGDIPGAASHCALYIWQQDATNLLLWDPDPNGAGEVTLYVAGSPTTIATGRKVSASPGLVSADIVKAVISAGGNTLALWVNSTQLGADIDITAHAATLSAMTKKGFYTVQERMVRRAIWTPA